MESADVDAGGRRKILLWLSRGFLSLWAVGFAWVVAAFLKAPESHRSLGQRTLDIGRLDEIRVGEGLLVRNGKEPVMVVRTAEDEVVALSAICTHLHCVLRYRPASEQLLCPCHAGVFDLNGNVLSGPPPRSIRRYGVSQQLGRVYVHFGQSGGDAT